MSITENLKHIKNTLPTHVTLVAVSKTKPNEDIVEAYEAGQRIFGENKIQEMTDKYEALPKDIEWHMIGHVQRNKVKYMACLLYTSFSLRGFAGGVYTNTFDDKFTGSKVESAVKFENFDKNNIGYRLGVGVDVLKFTLDVSYDGSFSKTNKEIGSKPNTWMVSLGWFIL